MTTITDILQNIDHLEKKSSKLHNKHMLETLAFSPLIVQAIGNYMDDSQINRLLRDGIEDEKDRAFITLFDMAFDQIKPIEEDFIVFRGISPPEGEFAGFYPTDKGFVSTSVDLQTTAPFRGGSCCLQIIIIPKGSKVLFLPSKLSTLFKDEKEVLLNRNSSFELIEEGNFQVENESGTLDTVKTVLLLYKPGDFKKPSRFDYCKVLIEGKLQEWEYSHYDKQKTNEDFKKFVRYFPDTCQMITRQNFYDLLHFFLQYIKDKLLNTEKFRVSQWYDFYFFFLETYPQFLKGDRDILSLEDKINMEIFDLLIENFRNYNMCWDFANRILRYGKNLSPFITLIRFQIPGFRLEINKEINVSDVQILYALHPEARDFNNVWYAIYHSNDESLLNFALTYQISINQSFLTNELLLSNVKLTAQLAKLSFTKSNMRGALIRLWTRLFALNDLYLVQTLIDNEVPFVANDYLIALLESRVSSEIKSIIIPYINF